MFDFLKVNNGSKKAGVKKGPRKGSNISASKGTIKIDKHVFNIREINKKGFILDPYDRDIIVTGQRFRFEIDAQNGDEEYKGRAEAVVTKIVNNALAAAFTTKFFVEKAGAKDG